MAIITASPWKRIKPALIDVFTKVGADQITSPGGVHLPFETPEWIAQWRDRRVEFIHPGQGYGLFLKITNIVGLGWDDITYESLDTGIMAGLPASGVIDVFETTSGIRKFKLQAQVVCDEESDDLSAADVVERLRDRMWFNSSIQQLLAVNVAIVDIGNARDMMTTIGKKRMSVVNLDFDFAACVISTDPIPTGYIEHVILTSHEQAGGVDVDASLRMIAELLPPA